MLPHPERIVLVEPINASALRVDQWVVVEWVSDTDRKCWGVKGKWL